uniref:CaM_binding domain-containing protein n=1 Tax=Toxocara canis TaxID=6265 RepID=A0A183U5S2_TOXCA
LKDEILGQESNTGAELDKELSDGEDDDLLKVVHKDVFRVLDDQDEDDANSSEFRPKKREKTLRKSALVSKTLKKGIRLNVRKVFNEDGEEITESHSTGAEIMGENSNRFDLEAAKREMAEIDKIDKVTYKEKMKRLRQAMLLLSASNFA